MYKLFIADDEAIIREGLRCLLDWETLGFTIAGEAANGDAALQFLLSETPDLVLLDIRMPGMSGLDVVRIAREHGYDGKVVILSGYSDFNYARTATVYSPISPSPSTKMSFSRSSRRYGISWIPMPAPGILLRITGRKHTIPSSGICLPALPPMTVWIVRNCI